MEWREDVRVAARTIDVAEDLDVGVIGGHVVAVIADVVRGLDSELPPDVQSPALNRTERVHCAGHCVSHGYTHDALAACVDKVEVRPHLIEAIAPVLSVPVAQLSRLVRPPALDVSVIDERAGVVLPRVKSQDLIIRVVEVCHVH